MTVMLESLDIGPQEFQACKDAVEKMAYLNWLDAGCPQGRDLEFWLKAAREWIETAMFPAALVTASEPNPTRAQRYPRRRT